MIDKASLAGLGIGTVDGYSHFSRAMEKIMWGKSSEKGTEGNLVPPNLENLMGIALLGGALVLFPSNGNWSEEFYIFARSVAFPLACLCVLWSIKRHHKFWFAFSIFAILTFNPVVPILKNESWDAFGMFYSVLFGALGFRLINAKNSAFAGIAFGVVGAILICLTFYVNYNMPRGVMHPTGDIICMNDGRGPCGESQIEDLSELNIPAWAKFLRKNVMWTFVFFGLSTILLLQKSTQKLSSEFEQRIDK